MGIRATLMILCLALIQCTSPFDFEVVDTAEVMVIDASFTNEQQVHQARLSYSFALDESSDRPVVGARVWIETGNGEEINYAETKPGIYETGPNVAGRIGESYAMHIAVDDVELVSSMETMLEPMRIDSVYGRYMEVSFGDGTNRLGVQFFVDASGTDTQARSNRYEFEETYEIFLRYGSYYEWDTVELVPVFRDTILDLCYVTNFSEELLVNTTAGLAGNSVREFPLRFIGEDDLELRRRYSLSVRQYGISPANFQFYKELKENNESAGSFFDEQRGLIPGNIRSVDNPQFPVLGYFEVAGVTEYRRIFENREFTPQGFRVSLLDNSGCLLDTVAQGMEIAEYMATFPTANIFNFSSQIPFPLLVSSKQCTDCRVFGELRKPDFWD